MWLVGAGPRHVRGRGGRAAGGLAASDLAAPPGRKVRWPLSRRRAGPLPATPGRRYATAGLVAFIGIAVSILVWSRAGGVRRAELSGMLGSLADGTASTLEWQLDRDVDAVRGLGMLWQTGARPREDAWAFDAGFILDRFPGVQWIAWVSRDSSALRFVARDTSARIPPRVLGQARFELNAPANAVRDRWSDAYQLDVFMPVRAAGESLSVLVGEIRVDSLWLKRYAMLSGDLSITLASESGRRLALRALPARLAPPWMRLRRSLTSPAGTVLGVDLVPSDALVRQVATPWPRLFLATGAFLSIAVGVLLLLVLRLNDFSAALARTNRSLDAQLAELSDRDRELRELNEALELRVRARTAELSQALREVETFSHSISHDLRSPIGAILNFAAVLEEDYGPQLETEGGRLLERIRGAAGRANQLLDALGEFAASGSTPEETHTVDMAELAQRAFAEAKGREGGDGDVRFTLGALPPAWADPTLVHRLLVNLFGNALKFSRGREPRVIEAGGAEDPAENAYWVRDNGRGFEPARAAELFEPFRRLHGSDVEGTGLGLAIVARSVSRMGGRVWAESDGATGATFHFTLPRPERGGDAPSGHPDRG